jgi:glycosyltransferase involved in cell wall biosynthesis
VKIRFITPYFPPEVGAAQTRINELAAQLQSLGHEVSVLTTFPNYPTGIVPQEWRGKLFWKDVEGKVPTYRIWTYATANSGFLRRITSHISFALFASLAGLFLPKCDVSIIESPPLFDGFVGVFLRTLRRMPYVFMVSDLWPESAVQMGMLKNRFLIKASKGMELLFYRQSTGVLALTAGIHRAIISDGISESKVMLFRNSVDCNFFRPGVNGSAIREELGISQSAFVALYAGTFGLAQNLTTILEAASLLKSEQSTKDIHFVLAGAGAESEILLRKARELALRNVSIINPLSKSRMPELINSADCVVVPLRDLEIFRGALPTKMFEAMACGRAVILAIAGEAEVLMREADAGCCVPPESATGIRDTVKHLADNPELTRRMGDNGRNYVLRHFSREARARELSDALYEFLHLPSKGPFSAPSVDTGSLQLATDTQEKEGI